MHVFLISCDYNHRIIECYTNICVIACYNIAFVNSERWLANSCVDITQCQHGNVGKFISLYFFVLYYKTNIKNFSVLIYSYINTENVFYLLIIKHYTPMPTEPYIRPDNIKERTYIFISKFVGSQQKNNVWVSMIAKYSLLGLGKFL
jgi:hypothetical protein